jgi:hypothetical protein
MSKYRFPDQYSAQIFAAPDSFLPVTGFAPLQGAPLWLHLFATIVCHHDVPS